jgi:hypothetical protein
VWAEAQADLATSRLGWRMQARLAHRGKPTGEEAGLAGMAEWAPDAAATGSQGARTRKWLTRRPGPHLDKPSPLIVERRLGRSVVLFVFVFLLGPEIGGRWVCWSWATRNQPNRRTWGSGDERLQGRRRLGHGDLFDQEIILDFGEGGERLLALEDGAHVPELLVQAVKDRENKCPVKDRLAQITK